MSQLALELIAANLRSQAPSLDLVRCGLTDALVAQGTASRNPSEDFQSFRRV